MWVMRCVGCEVYGLMKVCDCEVFGLIVRF